MLFHNNIYNICSDQCTVQAFYIRSEINITYVYVNISLKYLKKMKKESTKCTHKTCEHCSKLSNPPNYTEDEYDYLAKGK